MTASGEEGNAAIPYSHAQTPAFDANALSHDISTPGFLRCTAAPHEWTVGMRWSVCANSHIALVRVDPVEQSLRSHPFHGQTTLQQWETQQNRSGQQNHSVQSRRQQHEPKHTQIVLVLPLLSSHRPPQYKCEL